MVKEADVQQMDQSVQRRAYVDSEDPDQPAHLYSLFGALRKQAYSNI